jgi:hypothetical protein
MNQDTRNLKTNSEKGLIAAAIVFPVPILTSGVDTFSLLLACWACSPFLIFSFLVRKLPNRAYGFLCFGAVLIYLVAGLLVFGDFLGSRGMIALLTVPLYEACVLITFPLSHLAWRVLSAK